jgi:indole-3-glycerol phosphate synthase
MAYTYHDLKLKSVAELREISKTIDNEDLKGAMQLNKEHLLPVLCKALGIDPHEHHEAKGIDKAAIKAKMRALKAERAKALEAHDAAKLKAVRRTLHRLNHKIRMASA